MKHEKCNKNIIQVFADVDIELQIIPLSLWIINNSITLNVFPKTQKTHPLYDFIYHKYNMLLKALSITCTSLCSCLFHQKLDNNNIKTFILL